MKHCQAVLIPIDQIFTVKNICSWQIYVQKGGLGSKLEKRAGHWAASPHIVRKQAAADADDADDADADDTGQLHHI